MFQTASRLLPELSLILLTAVSTHWVVSSARALMHYKFGHHSMIDFLWDRILGTSRIEDERRQYKTNGIFCIDGRFAEL
jgi:diphthamide biosynthesis methyltransferase